MNNKQREIRCPFIARILSQLKTNLSLMLAHIVEHFVLWYSLSSLELFTAKPNLHKRGSYCAKVPRCQQICSSSLSINTGNYGFETRQARAKFSFQ